VNVAPTAFHAELAAFDSVTRIAASGGGNQGFVAPSPGTNRMSVI
jgi:hypothetical protein